MVGEAVSPISCSGAPKLSPGAPAGTWKQQMPLEPPPSPVRANVVYEVGHARRG